ncbi:MAG: dTDP-4-dehydrorhamnose reductase [Magnetospirillum sp.]|nr:dTDP-4-dehydrorhamnose reductase [Magnetospirillum sp.]
MVTRPLLFGANGQVGFELAQRADFEIIPRSEADFTNPAACHAAVLKRRPNVVVNAAAFTAVDRAESESGLAFAINADTPAALAQACAQLAIPLIHLSTDFVFDGGKSGPYDEADAPRPLSVYGASKLAGEDAIRTCLDRHVILRTAWVFSARRDNFIKTMLGLAHRPELKVVDDQTGGPTPAAQVAMAVCRILDAVAMGRAEWGTFHFCGTPAVSRLALAAAAFAVLGRGPRLFPTPSASFPLPARRPANSMLDCRRLHQAYGITPPDWRSALPAIIRSLEGSAI